MMQEHLCSEELSGLYCTLKFDNLLVEQYFRHKCSIELKGTRFAARFIGEVALISPQAI